MRTSSVLAALEAALGLQLSLQGVHGAGQQTWLQYFEAGRDNHQGNNNMMTRGRRRMSIVNPINTDDDSKATEAPKSTSKSSSSSSSSTSAKQDDTSPSPTSASSSSSSSSSTSASSSSPKSSSNSTYSSATSAQKIPSGDATMPTPSKNTSASLPANATKTATQPPTKVSDPGEHHSSTFKKPLPPSYNYKDDDNFPTLDNSPLNPVVDDIAQFLDDDHVNATHSVLPPEKEPPTSWPIDVFAIFLGAAVLLFAATAYKNFKKRKAYTAVPSSR